MNINRIYFLRGKIKRYVDKNYPEEASGRTYQEVLAERNLNELLDCDVLLNGMLNRQSADEMYEKTRLDEIEKIIEALTKNLI